MPKPLLSVAGLAGAMMHAPVALGPGHCRVNADVDEAEVYIYGDIGGWWDGINAQDFAKEIDSIDAETINVRLNSGGGVVFDGVAIYNALARHKSRIVVHIDGIAASIASVIAMAGDEIRIGEGCHVMIHKPWSFVVGDSAAMTKEAEVLDKLEGGIIDIYAARTEQDRPDLEKWVAAETWFTGQDAVDNGFADTLVPAKKKALASVAARSAMLPLFRHTPQALKDLRARDQEVPAIREFERSLRDGEGISTAQARRIAALARAQLGPRDVDREPLSTLRDEGARASELAAFERAIASLTNLSRSLKEG